MVVMKEKSNGHFFRLDTCCHIKDFSCVCATWHTHGAHVCVSLVIKHPFKGIRWDAIGGGSGSNEG